MAQRYWKACWNMGYPGTETKENIDLIDYGILTKDLNELSDEEAEAIIVDIAYEKASNMIEISVEKVSDSEE